MNKSNKYPSPFWQGIRANHKLRYQAPSIKPRPRNGEIPLSFGQERLWLVDQLQPDTIAHNLRAIFRLKGPLDLAALRNSLQEIINRHDILRTRFPASEGQPVQVIRPSLGLELPLVDLGHLPPEEREDEARRLATVETHRPFDLSRGPLLRLRLLRLAEDDHLLVRTIHHIINDRWSDSLFIGELARLYPAFVAGQPSPLPDLPVQYADFAVCQRRWLRGDRWQAHLDYWQQQLAGPLSPVALPVDASPLAAATYRGDAQYLTLSPALTKSLKRTAQRAGVSLFVVLLASFKTLLHQYSGQTDITLCAPVAGRSQVETRKLIGYFNNLVLLRTSFDGNPTFREMIDRVGQATVGAFQHQQVPVQQIAEVLNIPSPVLSRVMFALQNVPGFPSEMAGIKIAPLDMPDGISNFDLSLSMKMLAGKTEDEHLRGVLRYKTDLFQEATVTRLLANFQDLLQKLADAPEQRLSDLPRLTGKNGKNGKNAAQEASQAAAVYVPPQSEMERLVAGIWQEVLRLDHISIEANFFEIGGRSLALMQIAAQLQETLKRTIPSVELFKRPTIKEMAAYLDREPLMPAINTRQMRDRTERQRDALKRRKRQYKNIVHKEEAGQKDDRQ